MDKYIQTILDREACNRHQAPNGIPCFHIPKSTENGYFAGICNRRAKKAGFIGSPGPQSLRKTR